MTSVSTDRRYGMNTNAAIKVGVACRTTANITLSAEQTIDGVTTSESDVLVANQTTASENGIYTTGSGAWTRRGDFDNSYDVVNGTLIYVRSGGTTYGNTWWYVSNTGTITIGTTSLTFAQFNSLTYTEPSQQTVASAATGADIWTAEGVVNWTGTETTTALGAATRVGQKRLLICADACKFTAGANLIIEGIQSGVTVTMKANALVEVLAITTTQFKLTYSLSGSFTATGTGFASNPTATWYYSVTNGSVHITPHNSLLTGTSNATTFTVTGFPAEIVPENPTAAKDTRLFLNLVGQDNGSYVYTVYGALDETAVLNLYPTPAAGNWTASGTKLLVAQELYYSL